MMQKNKIPAHQRNVILEILVYDSTGDDFDVPYVMLKLDK